MPAQGQGRAVPACAHARGLRPGVPLIVLAVLIGGCTATLPRAARWEHSCLGPLNEMVLAVAGSEVTNCGYSNKRNSAAAACARRSLASGEPFRAGYGFNGIDSGECVAAVRKPDGSLWAVSIPYEFNGSPGDAGFGPSLHVQRCETLSVKPRHCTYEIPFEFQHCQVDEAVIERLDQQLSDARRAANGKPLD